MKIKELQAKVFGECPDCRAPLNWRGDCTGIINLYKRWDKERYDQQSVQRTAGPWRKFINFVGRVAGSLRRR